VVIDRVLVLALVGAALALLWLGLRWRAARLRRPGARDLLARFMVSGSPLVMAFTTPQCVPCRTMQRPALEELERRFPGRVEVREVDAADVPDLADRFGIMTVPSTVVIDPQGGVVAINYGLARWEKLAAQLSLRPAPAAPLVRDLRKA